MTLLKSACLLTVLLSLNTFAQSDDVNIGDSEYSANESTQTEEYSCQEISEKIAGFTRLRNAGIGLMVGGAVLTGIGVGMVIDAGGETSYETNTNGEESGDMGGATGGIFASIGVPMFIAGAVLLPLGIKKIREYTDRQQLQNCSIQLKALRNGMALVVDF